MNIEVSDMQLGACRSGALVVLLFEPAEGKGDISGDNARATDEATGGWIRELISSGECSGKAQESALLARPAGLAAGRLLVMGAGKRETFTPADLRKLAGTALRTLKAQKVRTIALALDGDLATEEYASAAVEGALLGDFEPDRYKTEKNGTPVESFTLLGGGDVAAGAARGRILAEAQNFARELVNEPGNRMTPAVLAERAQQMAASAGLECELLGPDRMKQLGMGALLGVAQGSAEPPALIVVRYRPAEASSAAHLALVGKGVTFDTGGISIKPADGMEKMKYDMAGGAAVLGAMLALAQLKPSVAVTAIIPAVENMPGSKAQRPGDIVTTFSGKTVEVLNTDAEGRLILCDAIEYAKRLGATHMVDAATLTGAIVVALGHFNVGVFTNNEEFRNRLLASARAEGEKMWPMPLDDDYKDLLKSSFADLQNIGTRWGGAISAAMFLKHFADPVPWIHLDIAGTAWNDDKKAFLAKGPTGVAVRTFVNLAMNW
ncbi:MAG: leucyl aminopeptidase [Bryobacteraceae bacterium]|nr:leucyl aminopeptidase [Bryobacteraceae bacterium]